MPRVPFYSGSIASAVLPQSPVRELPDYDRLTRDVSNSIGEAFGFARQNKAAKDLARQRAAAAAVDEQKVEQAKAAAGARSKLASTLDELAYRSGGPPPAGSTFVNTATPPIAESYPVTGQDPAAVEAAAEAQPARLRQLVMQAYRDAAGSGGNAMENGGASALLPIVQSFFAGQGDDANIVRANAALDGKYLAEDASPSLQRQDTIREDKQSHDMDKQQNDLRMKKYGFDVESRDRRYNTDVDASTSRANNASSVGEQARAHNLEHDDRRRGDYEKNYIDMLKFYTPERQATMKTEVGPGGKKSAKVVTEKGRRQPAKARPDPLGLR